MPYKMDLNTEAPRYRVFLFHLYLNKFPLWLCASVFYLYILIQSITTSLLLQQEHHVSFAIHQLSFVGICTGFNTFY